MRNPLPDGCGVALVTPFTAQGLLDREALHRMVDYVINGGCSSIVVLGTTGEAVSQSRAECIEVLRLVHEHADGRVPLVAGPFGGNSTTGILERFQDYAEVFDLPGYVALMSSVPSYVKPNQEGVYRHFMKVAEHAPLPILLYNVPSRTGTHMTAATTLRLAHASGLFLGVKEASGSMTEGMALVRDAPGGFKVFSGDDTTALPLMACGAHGVISVVANAYPRVFSSMTTAALAGNFRQARTHNDVLLDVHAGLYVDGNPSGIKAVLAQLELCGDTVRLPAAPVRATTRDLLVQHVLQIEAARAPGLVG